MRRQSPTACRFEHKTDVLYCSTLSVVVLPPGCEHLYRVHMRIVYQCCVLPWLL